MLIIDATSIEEIKRQLRHYFGNYTWVTNQDGDGFALCVGEGSRDVQEELTGLLASKRKAKET